MKTIINSMIVLLAVLVLAGCAPRGEIALHDANPDAYEATRGEDRATGNDDNDNDNDNGDDGADSDADA